MENTLLTLQYWISENDLLQASLYLKKENNHLKKYIFQNWLIWFLIYLVIAVVFLLNKNYYPALAVGVFAAVRLILLPGRMKERVFKNAQKEVKVFAGKIDSITTLNITSSALEISGNTRESKTKISEIKSAIETGRHFFVKLNLETVIIPKAQLQNVADTKDKLQSITKDLQVPYITDTSWKW